MRNKLFTVEVLGTDVPVFEESSALWGSRTGVYSGRSHSIVINAGVQPQVKRITFFHELFEAAGALSGVRFTQTQMDQCACVSLHLFRRSAGLTEWLAGGRRAPLSVRILTTDCTVVEPEDELWEGPCVRVSLPEACVYLEAAAGDRDRKTSLLYAALMCGVEQMGGTVSRTAARTASEVLFEFVLSSADGLKWVLSGRKDRESEQHGRD